MTDKPAGQPPETPFLDHDSSDTDQEQILKLLYKAAESASEMILITDAAPQVGEEKIIYVNSGFENVTGYSREEVLGKNPKILRGPDTEEEVIDRLRERVAKGEHFEGETFNYRKDGTRYRVRWNIDPVFNDEGEVTHFISLQRDVTQEWKDKQRLEQVIEERESMIQETHHRIKNNLAVITGLLELQSAQTSSAEARKTLAESMNRVQSIATLHEKLYNTGDFTTINLAAYYHELIEHLEQSFKPPDKEIRVSTDLADITLPVRQAVPCGLILNELVTNAFQHAFEGREKGVVSISLCEKGDTIVLEVHDDGVGLPGDTDISNLDSLGLRLIKVLTQQLGGSYSYDTGDDGTTFTIRFDTSEADR